MALVYLVALWCGHKMMVGRLPPMAYQDVGSVTMSLIGSALTTSDPSFAYLQRTGLTGIGTMVAASIIILIDQFIARILPMERPAEKAEIIGKVREAVAG